ncbi:MAG: hypothetical protein Q4E24_09710 [bacterium]|nr:hypothetical protein [bacterium]
MKLEPITVNGYNTYYVDKTDCLDPHLIIAIPSNAQKDIANLCMSTICGHLITRIDYEVINGTRFILAYY